MMIMIILAILLYFWSLYNIDAGTKKKTTTTSRERKKKLNQMHYIH